LYEGELFCRLAACICDEVMLADFCASAQWLLSKNNVGESGERQNIVSEMKAYRLCFASG
jgi:hypothetical protein